MRLERVAVAGHEVEEGLAADEDHAAVALIASAPPEVVRDDGRAMTRCHAVPPGAISPSRGDQGRRADDRAGGPVLAVEAGEEQLRRRAPDPVRVLGDDREPRLDRVGERQVVEADERDVVPAPHARGGPRWRRS